ncbi:MAG: hypothetical protein BroJett011_30710 [Chloroflexota bacterium]|nr:MAG: hypothetical protein BroJett011_30710 [Chloroflexota bacterium]
MSTSSPLPFDALRPFKSRPEEFTPRDTLPWAAQAEQLLRCRSAAGFWPFSPARVIEPRVDWLAEDLRLPSGAAILDIGCGPGLYSNRLAARGFRLTGIDIAQPFLDYAQGEADRQGLACVYRHLSLFDLTFEAEFEAVLLINAVTDRLSLAELPSVLAKIWAALKPGGHLIAEFAVQPANFSAAPPTIRESLHFLGRSPWSEQPHAWLVRELTFPTSSERVTHHLILAADGQPREYWSRFALHPLSELTDLLARYGLQTLQLFGPALGQVHRPTDTICFIWAQRP